IIKPGIPALSGATAPEACAVIEQVARQRRAPLKQLGVDFHYQYEPGEVTDSAWRRPRVHIRTAQRPWHALELGLLGKHQAANAALTVACVEQLRQQGWRIPDSAVVEGVRDVGWPARLEVVQRRPLVILDCAHNVASAEALVETLQTSFLAGKGR